MAAVERELIRARRRAGVLFTPPFDRTAHDPGYIKGYPPGVRENGGQYTHAADWSVIAFARLGEGDEAAALFSHAQPINHAHPPIGLRRYKVEPYVIAGDVFRRGPSAVVAGPGIPARPLGCIAPGPKRYWDCASWGRTVHVSIRASQRHGPVSR